MLRWRRRRDRRQDLVNLTHDALVHVQTIHHLLLREANPVRGGDLVGLFGAVNLLCDALDLPPGVGGGLPDDAQLGQGADAQADLLAQVLLVLDKVQGPLGQVDDGGHGDDAGEEVRVLVQGHGVRDHFGDVAGRRDGVPRVDVEGVARGHRPVRGAAVDAAGGRGVELGVWLVKHDGTAKTKKKTKKKTVSSGIYKFVTRPTRVCIRLRKKRGWGALTQSL